MVSLLFKPSKAKVSLSNLHGLKMCSEKKWTLSRSSFAPDSWFLLHQCLDWSRGDIIVDSSVYVKHQVRNLDVSLEEDQRKQASRIGSTSVWIAGKVSSRCAVIF